MESGLSVSLELAHPSQCGLAPPGRKSSSVLRSYMRSAPWQCVGPARERQLGQSWVSTETATVSIGYPQGLHSMLAWWSGPVEPNGRVPPDSTQKVVCDPIKCKSTRRSLMGKQVIGASQVKGGSAG